MATKFLHGADILAAVREASAQHVERSFGVAYWGVGAVERLGLGADLGATKVVCDLWSEACNPDAILALLEHGAQIRHVEGFHAKTYLFPDRVVVGSANASRAGLGEPEEAAPTRTEAALLCDDPAVLGDARQWFRTTWKKGSPVDGATVEAARPAAAAKAERPSLLHALAHEPELFSGLDLVLTVYEDEGISDEAQITWNQVKGEYGEDDRRAYDRDDVTPFYEVAPDTARSAPPGRIYLDFTRAGKRLSYNGIWKVRSGDPKPVPGATTVLVMLDQLPSLRGRKSKSAEMTAFAKALAKRVGTDDVVLPDAAVTAAAREAIANG